MIHLLNREYSRYIQYIAKKYKYQQMIWFLRSSCP